MQHRTSGNQDAAMSNFLKDEIYIEIEKGGSVKVSVDASDILDFVQKQYEPEDVFDEDELSEWALANGFVKEE